MELIALGVAFFALGTALEGLWDRRKRQAERRALEELTGLQGLPRSPGELLDVAEGLERRARAEEDLLGALRDLPGASGEHSGRGAAPVSSMLTDNGEGAPPGRPSGPTPAARGAPPPDGSSPEKPGCYHWPGDGVLVREDDDVPVFRCRACGAFYRVDEDDRPRPAVQV